MKSLHRFMLILRKQILVVHVEKAVEYANWLHNGQVIGYTKDFLFVIFVFLNGF